jgi:hypothetical protein
MSAPPIAVSRFEMTITPDDLRRLALYLPSAGPVHVGDAEISSGASEGPQWRIRLSNTRSRSLGRLRLPVSNVEVMTLGYGEAEHDAFLERFHLVFRRGGG